MFYFNFDFFLSIFSLYLFDFSSHSKQLKHYFQFTVKVSNGPLISISGLPFITQATMTFFGYFCCCIVVCTLIQWPTLIQYSSLCFCLFSVFEYILKAVVCWCRLLLLLFQIFGSLHLWLVELNCTICLNNERVIKPVWHKWFAFSWKSAYTYRTSECRVN